MKIVQRIGIILLAALIVVGLTWGALQVPAVQSWVGSNNEHGGPPAAMQQGQVSSTDGTASTTAATTTDRPQRPTGGEGGEHNSGGNVLGLVEVGKNLGIVVAVSLVVGAAGWLVSKVKPKRPLAQTPSRAA